MAIYPGAHNTFVPSFEASGRLMVDYARNPNSFALNRYIAIQPVNETVGKYLKHTPDEAARVKNADLEDWVWADGAESPDNYIEKEFEFVNYSTIRRAYPFSLGDLSTEQADWNIIANYAATAASIAMTARTRKCLSVLQTAGNWSGNTATATAEGGGKWDVSGTSDLFIKKSIMSVAEKIHQATNGVVKLSDLVLVVSPNAARQMANSGEIHDYLQQSPVALDVIRGDTQFATWGLPSQLYGINLVVEDAVAVTSAKKGSRTDDYVLTNTNALFVSRPMGLETTEGSFSTCVLFEKEAMTAETMRDDNHRRTIGRVVDDFDVQVVSPVSGYLLTAIVD